MPRHLLSRFLRAGLLIGVVDFLFASVLGAVFYGSTVARVWQGVASTLVGSAALGRGTPMVLLGILIHFGVAFTWTAVFLLLFERSARSRRVTASPLGVLGVAALYGPLVWLVMSLAVIPLLVHRPPAITFRWWVQLLCHIPFVALPIVWAISRGYSEPGADGLVGDRG